MATTLTGDAELSLPEFDDPPAEPGALLAAWLERARERGVREALAATLATAGADGLPDARMVALVAVGADGVTFGTAEGSRKGRELAENPRAVVVLYWRELMQQLRIAGPVERLGADDSDAIFARRRREAQAATAVSVQGAPLGDLDRLRAAAREAADADGSVGRPAGWFGYRVLPERIEFWHAAPDRLHRRLEYRRTGSGWTAQLLQP